MFGLSKPRWEKSRKRAQKAEKSGLWADAYFYYAEAVAAAPDEEVGALKSALDSCGQRLFASHAEAAERYREMGDLQKTVERWELAANFAVDAEQKERARTMLRELAAQSLADEEAADWEEEETVEGGQLDEEHVFLMLIGDLPDHLIDEYQALGVDFQKSFLALQDGRAEEALPYLEKAAAEGDNPVLLYELGQCLRALKRYDDARIPLEKAEGLRPEWVDVKLSLTAGFWALEDWEGAEAALQRAIDLDVDDLRIYAAVVQTALLTKQPDYGLDAAEVVLEREPFNRPVLLLKGQLHQLRDEHAQALDCFESVVKRTWRYDHDEDQLVFDREAGVLAARIYLQQDTGLDRAEELTRAAIAVTPPTRRWAFEILLGQVLRASDREDEAKETWEQAARVIPEEEKLPRIRVAELLGREDEVEEIEASLADEERLALERVREEL